MVISSDLNWCSSGAALLFAKQIDFGINECTPNADRRVGLSANLEQSFVDR